MKAFLAGALLLVFPCAAMAQIAVLEIKVVEGEGAVHPLGAHVIHPLTVEVKDDSGRPVAGAAVSFQLPPQGPGGLFANGLRTDLVLTDQNGRATLHSMQLNRTPGQFHIRVVAVKEQARAGAVALEYIAEGHGSGPAAAPVKAVEARAPAKAPSQSPATARAGDITPTTVRMGSGSHKKWLMLAVVVGAGAGAAFVGVTHAAKGSNSPASSTAATIGTPVITIGHP